MSHEFRVNCGQSGYAVVVQPGAMGQAGAIFKQHGLSQGKVHIVSDSNVWPLYGESLSVALQVDGYICSHSVVPAGEDSKKMVIAEKIATEVAGNGLTRSDLLIALGGGVVGDLTGFVASIMYRGMRYVQLPSSFLAQVDSSIGGKTGVNASFGKNMLGTFHQPSLVIADAELLLTLPPNRLLDGFAEAIKTAVVANEDLYRHLFEISLPVSVAEYANIAAASLKTKAILVEADEKDLGQRMLLNFGHTLGHAIEAAGDFKLFSHGEAVALGMKAFAAIGEEKRISPPGTAEGINQLLNRFQLPDCAAGLQEQAVLAFAGLDKKAGGGHYRVIFLRKPGEGVIYSFTHDEYEQLIRGALGKVMANG